MCFISITHIRLKPNPKHQIMQNCHPSDNKIASTAHLLKNSNVSFNNIARSINKC